MQSNNEIIRYYRTAHQDEIAIFNQKAILDRYCEQHGLTTKASYFDNGYSGLNFDRPGWKQLLANTATGDVKTIVATNVSRIGRDTLKTVQLIEALYQNDGVDFIFVQDNLTAKDVAETSLLVQLSEPLAALAAQWEGGDVL